MPKTITARVWLLVGLAWGLGICTAGYLMYHSRKISADYDTVLEREVRLQDAARQMQVRFKIQVQEWKDVLLRGHDADALQKYSQAFHEDEKAVRQMAAALSNEAPDSQTRAMAEEFARAHIEMGARYASALQTFTQAKGLNAWAADKLVKGQDRAPTALVDKLAALLGERIQAQRSTQKRVQVTHTWVVSVVLLLGFGAVAVGSVLTVRALSTTLQQTAQELKQAARQVASAAAQVSMSSQSLAQGSCEQAAAVQQTSASSEEITSVARANSESSRSVAGLVTQSEQKFAQTEQTLSEMVAAMVEIDAQSGKISKIIKVIDEIAFQTNLLALNAAVEAARAGDSGVGFAVVADEVRNLAKRCAQAAKDTTSLIEESIVKSHEGKAKVDHVAGAIRSIADESRRVKALVDELDVGSQEQARGIEQIGKAISQIELVTQNTAASSEESAAAAEELATQAQAISLIVLRLRSLVSGNDDTSAHEQITQALAAHAAWKKRLSTAIEAQSSEVGADVVRKDNQCAFGKWLAGSTISSRAKQSRGYRECRELHTRFHRAAGNVLAAALAGRKDEAERAMAEGSEYAHVSAALTSALEAWDAELSK